MVHRKLLAALALAIVACTSHAPPSPPSLTGLEDDARTERVLPAIPLDPLARSRAETTPSAPRPRVVESPLPRRWPEEREEEDDEKLERAWEHSKVTRESVERALAAPREAMEALPPLPPGEMRPQSTTEWTQTGLGILDRDSAHHKAGRVKSAAYVWDHALGYRTLYVGGSSGGLWKLVIAGIIPIFVPISDTLPGSPSVGAFHVHPGDSSKILIASGDSFRYSGDGMYKTTNGGTSWSRMPLTPAPGAFYKVLGSSENTERVLACGDTGIFLSTNFGDTWTRIYSGACTDLAQDPGTPRFWYAGGPGIGVLESSDFGASFHPINTNGGNGIADPVGRVSLTVSASAPNFLYAIVENGSGGLGGIYRSSNFGFDWTRIDSVDMISWGQGQHTAAIAVDPRSPDRLFVGMGGVQWTDNATAATPCWTRNVGDGCAGCSTICVDGGHADFTGFVFVPQTTAGRSAKVIMTNDGGAYSYDIAANRIEGAMNTAGLALEQTGGIAVPRTDARKIYSGLQDNGMVRFDGTRNRFLGGGDGAGPTASPDDANAVYYSSGAPFSRFYSTDQGTTWNGINCSLGNEWASAVVVDQAWGLSSPRIFTNTDRFILSKPVSTTCDWTRLNATPFPAGWNARAVDRSVGSTTNATLAVAWGSGRLLVVEGTGTTGLPWFDRTPPLPTGSSVSDAWAYFDRSRAGTIYYTTGFSRPSKAYVSYDRGLNWRDVTGDLTTVAPNVNYYELIANPRDSQQLFLTTQIGVFRSFDRGLSWHRFMTGLPAVVDVNAIDANIDASGAVQLTIGTYGRGFWRRNL
jgi:hypothetical protein